MSLAMLAIELAFKKSPPPIFDYNNYIFYTCVRYLEYDKTYHIACVKGLFQTHSLNVFYVSLPFQKNWRINHRLILQDKYNAILYEYPVAKDA